MIAPKPFKYKCPQCRYSKVVKPQSDALNPLEMLSVCPKCKGQMERVELNILDEVVLKFSL